MQCVPGYWRNTRRLLSQRTWQRLVSAAKFGDCLVRRTPCSQPINTPERAIAALQVTISTAALTEAEEERYGLVLPRLLALRLAHSHLPGDLARLCGAGRARSRGTPATAGNRHGR